MGGFGALFKLKHDEEEIHLKAFSAWCIIKMYAVILLQTFNLIFVGFIIGFIGSAISFVIIGLLLGFLMSHLFWFIVVKMDGLCGPPGFLILGILCLVALLWLFIDVITHISVWEYFPAYIAVDIMNIIAAIPSFFQGVLLIQHFLNKNKQGADGGGDSTQAAPPPSEKEQPAGPQQPEGAVYMKNGEWLDKNDKPIRAAE